MADRPKAPPSETGRDLIRASRRAARRGIVPTPDYWRPAERRDCVDGARPCPFVGCRYNLTLDVMSGGGIVWRRPEVGDPNDLPDSNCALDHAGLGGMKLEDVGRQMGVSHQRIVMEEASALGRLKDLCTELGLAASDVLDHAGPTEK